MLQFERLRINGFKSFVEKTELEIGPGLSGVVGPNGCGKSNLVEALRWVMGESSAKRMRGGGMEDVIFNGTEKRSKRNIAEVSLVMSNPERTAPAAYNAADEIEITRKIERDHGSNYKINGRNARARDVQMLFADTVTGANSPALVSQGRVTEMINAKPLDRRMVLEESAGISGLFARRHEAELRLKAADSNLTRMQDLLGSMEGRLNSLKRQARQAARYKNLSAQIRQLEVQIAYIEWRTLEERMRDMRSKHGEAESVVADRLAVVTHLTKTQNTQAEDLPTLRRAEAEAAAALQAQKLALQRLEDEAAHHLKMLTEATEQMAQTKTDHEHASRELAEHTETLSRNDGEHKTILADQEKAGDALEAKKKICAELEEIVIDLEARYNALMQTTAEIKAQKDSLAQRIASTSSRLETLQSRKSNAERELETLKTSQPHASKDFNSEIAKLETKSEGLQEHVSNDTNALDGISPKIEEARKSLRETEKAFSEFEAEINILEKIVNTENEDDFEPVLGFVQPDKGFEKALSRALGDTLMASLDDKAATSWLKGSERGDLPVLPPGIEPLAPHVSAPVALKPALSQIGIVPDEDSGNKLWESLKPGQSLVSRGGTYWRWDGYRIKAEAADRHAQHLEQKNKLSELNAKRSGMERSVEKCENSLNDFINKQNDLQSNIKAKRQERNEIESTLTGLRRELSDHREKQARTIAAMERLEETIKTSAADIAELQSSLKSDEAQLKTYEKKADSEKEGKLEELKSKLAETRSAHAEAVRNFDIIQQQQNTRQARLHAIADERVNLQNRSIRAKERLKQLSERSDALGEKLTELNEQPQDHDDKKEQLLVNISMLDKKRNNAAEKLAITETAVAETARALKDAENTLGGARETRAHAQATLSALQEQYETMKKAIVDKFEVAPSQLPQHCAADLTNAAEMKPDAFKLQKDQLVRERDQIGAVNLRAEEEASALEGEVGTILSERNDLVQAIEELRGAITKINKEARERLVNAFEHVNTHFGRLFVQLYGGGRAHLALIDSDDPLKSGLEIFAQPPGKALQSLSLLSGGEQTLASIALIFAMFLTNPSPICVLDEIDAPLDDANVDRVCDLLEEIAEQGKTRFLVITHHRLTMARMDRLYGVTMAERGVSQLVSVDLQQSFEFVEAA
ncbi:MAG: chromosome segregation protein SMC [Micavibrio sp.]|nr:chromosome segregation protein SMC [Micavibrio sp.]